MLVGLLDKIKRPLVPLQQVGLHEASSGVSHYHTSKCSQVALTHSVTGRPTLNKALIRVLPFCTELIVD